MRTLTLPVLLGAASLLCACASGGDDDIQPLDMGPTGASGAPAAAPAGGRLSVDMSVARIASDPRGRAVLERDLPGMLGNPDYPFFKNMSLRRLQSLSGGRMTPETLSTVETDLEAASAAPPAG